MNKREEVGIYWRRGVEKEGGSGLKGEKETSEGCRAERKTRRRIEEIGGNKVRAGREWNKHARGVGRISYCDRKLGEGLGTRLSSLLTVSYCTISIMKL